jgi:hypothetical protein
MKILRKNDDFKKMPERNMDDVLVINNLLKLGWDYCSKKIYKEFNNGEVVETKKEVKKVKEPKVLNKPEKKKIERKTDKKKKNK